MAVAGLDVGQPVVLLGRRPQRLREQRPVLELDRELAATRPEDRAVGAEQIAEVERDEAVQGLLPQDIGPRVQLDTAGPVDEIQERGTPLPPPGGQPPGHAGPHLRLLT